MLNNYQTTENCDFSGKIILSMSCYKFDKFSNCTIYNMQFKQKKMTLFYF